MNHTRSGSHIQSRLGALPDVEEEFVIIDTRRIQVVGYADIVEAWENCGTRWNLDVRDAVVCADCCVVGYIIETHRCGSCRCCVLSTLQGQEVS